MDPLRAFGSTTPTVGGFAPGATLYPSQMDLSGLASARLGGLNPLSAGSTLAFADPSQSQGLMSQTAAALMSMVLQLMANRSSSDSSGNQSDVPAKVSQGSSSGGSAPSGGSSSSAAASGTPSNFGNSQGTGSAQPTDTGKKLAEIARAEATNGDSSGGWCYRDVGRSLAKIGVNVSGGSAYMAADQLANNPKVTEVKVGKDQLSKLPAGAIVVWDKGNGHEHGHISIATGDGKEASDLMRTQITNYGTAFRVFMPK